jgi:fatty acid desaturase
MMDTLATLYAMAAENPWWAWLAVGLFWLCVIGFALCLVSMLRPDLPLHRWEDDEEQQRAVTRPAGLDKPTHQVHIQPASNVIPWGRRVHDVERQP